jgi:hypothetical protein
MTSVAVTLLALFNPTGSLSQTVQIVLPSLAVPVALVSQVVYLIIRRGLKKDTLTALVQFVEAHFVDLQSAAKTVEQGYQQARKAGGAAKASSKPQAIAVPATPTTSEAPLTP